MSARSKMMTSSRNLNRPLLAVQVPGEVATDPASCARLNDTRQTLPNSIADMRKFHRWVSLPAAVFLLSVAVTGVILQFQQFFGEDEAQREQLATMTSAYSLDTPATNVAEMIDRARTTARSKFGDAKLDAVEVQLKGDHPTVALHVVGDSPRKLVVNGLTGAVESDELDERESFILRLHTGEVFGDGGVVLGMVWGTALVALTVTGAVLYWRMYRARARVKGWRQVFW